MFRMSIPKISKEEFKKRYDRIKPVVRVNGKLHYLRKFTLEEARRTSFLWNVKDNLGDEVKKRKLHALEGQDFICLHKYGYPGIFKPSVYEVVAQIDERILPLVRAFEIIECPENIDDFSKDSFTSIAYANGYHVSVVRLYGE